jgi:phage gpG-like protein
VSGGPISIEVNVGSVSQRLARQAGLFRDRTVPNRQLSVQLQGWVFSNFNAGGGRQSPGWTPLAPSTLAQKQRQGYSSRPLIRTGHLRQSFRGFFDNDSAGVGSEVRYSRYHEQGGRHLPRRSMLPPRAVVVDYAMKIYERWSADIVRK